MKKFFLSLAKIESLSRIYKVFNFNISSYILYKAGYDYKRILIPNKFANNAEKVHFQVINNYSV